MKIEGANASAVAQAARAAAAQEATETAAQTQKEAAAGDQQAVRLLARTAAGHAPPAASTGLSAPGKLNIVI